MQIRSAQKLAWENKAASGFNTTDVPQDAAGWAASPAAVQSSSIEPRSFAA
jgi:hypothetical protein